MQRFNGGLLIVVLLLGMVVICQSQEQNFYKQVLAKTPVVASTGY